MDSRSTPYRERVDIAAETGIYQGGPERGG